MDVQAELTREAAILSRIRSVATQQRSLGFGDLLWSRHADWITRLRDKTNPGVQLITPRRTLVFEFSGTLRYYAGGWCSSQDRLPIEQDRVWAEGYEFGEFATVSDALRFASFFLVDEMDLQV